MTSRKATSRSPLSACSKLFTDNSGGGHLNSLLPKPLMLYLPPPPEHPPPSDIGTPPDSPIHSSYGGEKNFGNGYYVDGSAHNHASSAVRNLHSDCERDMRCRPLPQPTHWSGSLNPRSQQMFRGGGRPLPPGPPLPAPYFQCNDPKLVATKPWTDSQTGYSARPPFGGNSDCASQASAFRNLRLPAVKDSDLARLYGGSEMPGNIVNKASQWMAGPLPSVHMGDVHGGSTDHGCSNPGSFRGQPNNLW